MKKFLKKLMICEKVGMTQIINDVAQVIPVTVLKAVDNTIVNCQTLSDNQHRILLGYGNVKPSRVNKPHSGQFKSRGLDVHKHLAEFLVTQSDAPGVALSLDQFKDKDRVFVQSRSKGCGFSGTIKRWNFRRGPESHGSKSHRIPGSIGAGTTPSRVVKGKKMAGQYGNATVTGENLRVERIDTDAKLLFVRGGVAGAPGATVVVGMR